MKQNSVEVKADGKTLRIDTIRLSSEECRTLLGAYNSKDGMVRPHDYRGSSLANLGLCEAVEKPKREKRDLDEAWRKVVRLVANRNREEVNRAIDEVINIEREMRQGAGVDYRITELGKKVARGFTVRMGSI